MANIIVNIEKGIEVAAADILKFLTGAETKTAQAAPGALAALGVLVGGFETAVKDVAGAAANPINIALDVQTVADLRAVWPEVVAFLLTLGVKV